MSFCLSWPIMLHLRFYMLLLSPNSWSSFPDTRSSRVSMATSLRRSGGVRKWLATCVWIPSWWHRRPLWRRCAPRWSAASPPSSMMELCVGVLAVHGSSFSAGWSSLSLLCSQPVTVTLKAPSAVSVTQWGVSVFAKPTSLVSAATSAPQEVTASESLAALVSVCEAEAEANSLAWFHTGQWFESHDSSYPLTLSVI